MLSDARYRASNRKGMHMQTHEVINQALPLVDYDMFSSDAVLRDLVARFGAEWALERLVSFGKFNGSAQAIDWAIQANRNEPVLHTHDRFGQRIDKVEFHPAYHQLMQASIEHGLHNLPWQEPRAGAHVARAAMMYMAFQNEAGHCCPISMTYSAVPSLRRQSDLAKIWEPLVLTRKYDGSFQPAAAKTGITIGMGMTEKQGGSDVRANTTRAVPRAEPGAGKEYLLTGHKWFCSAPMSDAFLVLAQAAKGLSCFLVPRWQQDGSKNRIFIQRLKDKLGNRSNASSEIELENASGWLIGEEGRGVPTIIEMVNHTRLDCTIGAAALMRQATLQALHHAHHRSTFGKKLSQHPLMLNVLADLALEAEAAARLMMRVAHAYDRQEDSAAEAHFKRIASAIAKYWICKRAPMHVAEALECFGGNGYVEEGPMPRLFRESPLLGIWEGSGNVICLDVLRAVSKEPETLDAVVAELDKAGGLSSRLDAFVRSLKRDIAALKKSASSKKASVAAAREQSARRLVERLALAMQAALMIQQAPGYAADAFIASRLGHQGGLAFGTLPRNADVKAIVARAYPFGTQGEKTKQ
jgi:putative acyl-CoA dehydrogenase